ncbi:MAG: DUF2780 domain-containing protein [Fuerstiella sp.]
MDEFISMVTQKLGIGETEGKSATAGILGMIQGQMDESAFKSVLEKLPGAEALLQDDSGAQQDAGTGGGLLGSLSSMAGGLLGGGKKSGMAGMAAALAGSGLGLDKIGDFVSMLMGFLKDKLGDETFQSVVSAIPGMDGSQSDKS